MVELLGGGLAWSWDLTSLNRTHSGGGRLVWERFPCSQQLHFHKPRGGKGQGDSGRKTERGLRGETAEMRKRRTQQAERAEGAPRASKVATGEK